MHLSPLDGWDGVFVGLVAAFERVIDLDVDIGAYIDRHA